MNKRLLGIFIGLFVAVTVIVVCCVTFLIGSVEVQTTDGLILEKEQTDDIIAKSGISKGSSIFSINEQSSAQAVEKAYPYLKVVTIERKFPNKVIIKITSRTELLAVSLEGNGEYAYAVLDRELKILRLSDEAGIQGLTVVSGAFKVAGDNDIVGSFVSEKSDWLYGIVKGAEKVHFVGEKFNNFITHIEYGQINILSKTNTGVTFVLKNVSNIDELFQNAYRYYSTVATEEQRRSGFITFTDGGWMWSATMIN